MEHPMDQLRTRTNALSGWAKFRAGAVLFFLLGLLPVAGEQARFLLLHTADVHDHLRPGYIGIGGMPYVSGYINQVRENREDVLLVDGGDLLEKGDLVAYRSSGNVTAELFRRIGYDAIAFGNHDFDYGVPGLRRFEAILGQGFLMLNLVNPEGEPVFEPSRVVEVNGIRVGLIGMIDPRNPHFGGLDAEASGQVLAAEAKRLKEESHLVIAICHAGTRQLKEWSVMAPAVDVLVAAHTHETLLEPMVVGETGALIVSAGSNAHWVGRLELEVDLEEKQVVDYSGELVLMRHDTIPVDAAMVSWLQEQEQLYAPEASEWVMDLEEPVDWFALARLAAEAIRVEAGTDIAFYHPTQIVRNALPAGPIDVNALFRISAERVDPLLRVQMSGAEITHYLDGLSMSDWGQTQWAGLSLEVQEKANGKSIYRNNLDPDQLYSVTLPEREYQRYFVQHFEPTYVRTLYDSRFASPAPGEPQPRRNFPVEPMPFTFLEAITKYLKEVTASGQALPERLAQLQEQQGGIDPNELRFRERLMQNVRPEYFLKMEAASKE